MTNNNAISNASPHTIKKFELVENYIKGWARKLLNFKPCNGIIFIDCMCNSGVYKDNDGKECIGTPVRVASVLQRCAAQYSGKAIDLYFNDNSQEKITLLKKQLPNESSNFHIHTSVQDANAFLIEKCDELTVNQNIHYFLFYDPYDACINWQALAPFLRRWGEVLITHMTMDSVRAIGQVTREETKKKYEGTYLQDFEKLLPYGNDKKSYEKRILKIIDVLKGERQYYIASFPFFNKTNSQIYDLIHCTGNKEGFRLFKNTAWKTFGGKSSTKNTHGKEDQMTLFPEDNIQEDADCFNIHDIARYLQNIFCGQKDVPLKNIWCALQNHPVFPDEGYREEIKATLKAMYSAKVSKATLTFSAQE